MNMPGKKPHLVISVGDDKIIAAPFGIPGAAPCAAAYDDKDGARRIAGFIDSHPSANVILLADNLAQDYRCDELPTLNIIDKAKLVRRRLKQMFPSARLTASLNFKNAPRRVLMIGVHESNQVFAWADKLRHRLPVIALLPVEGARLIARLMPEAASGWAMTVARQKSGGFRQIVTHKNDLVFTRLTPLPPDSSSNEAEIVARDIEASLDYLARQGLREARELSVLLLGTAGSNGTAAFEALSLKSIRRMSLSEAARKLNLSPLSANEDGGDADFLFAAHVASSLRPALSLMLPDIRKARTENLIRAWGTKIGYACLAASVALALTRAESLAVTLYKTQKAAFDLAAAQSALSREQTETAPLAEPLALMRQALARRHIFERPTPTPWQAVNELAAGLDGTAKLVKLDWKKFGEESPEILAISLRMESADLAEDRAEAVATFLEAVQNIERAAPDFVVSVIKTPYPALPQDSISTASLDKDDPVGEIVMKRKPQ